MHRDWSRISAQRVWRGFSGRRIREHEIADITKKPEFTPFYRKFSLFVFISEKNIAFLFSLLFVEQK
jgi:hypothetical protein